MAHAHPYPPCPRAPPQALALGIALQLTNILRDVGEDARRGRIYLPREDLVRFGVTEEQILSGVLDDNYVRLMQFQIARARDYFDKSEDGIVKLAASARMPVRASLDLYRKILERLEQNGFDNFRKRAYVSKVRAQRRRAPRPRRAPPPPSSTPGRLSEGRRKQHTRSRTRVRARTPAPAPALRVLVSLISYRAALAALPRARLSLCSLRSFSRCPPRGLSASRRRTRPSAPASGCDPARARQGLRRLSNSPAAALPMTTVIVRACLGNQPGVSPGERVCCLRPVVT